MAIDPRMRLTPAGSAPSPGTCARHNADSWLTGPPVYSRPGTVARLCHCGSTASTSTGLGRFTTTPSAPCSA
jgi:hypothetical protein